MKNKLLFYKLLSVVVNGLYHRELSIPFFPEVVPATWLSRRGFSDISALANEPFLIPSNDRGFSVGSERPKNSWLFGSSQIIKHIQIISMNLLVSNFSPFNVF